MILREMLVDDLDQVMEIEEELFSVSGHAPAQPVKHGDNPVCAQPLSRFCLLYNKGHQVHLQHLLSVWKDGPVQKKTVQ